MTTGNPIKIILSFSLPVMLGQLLQLAYNMADTVIVGRTIGVEALAAVSATGTIFNFFGYGIIGLMSGFSLVAGKKYGAKDYEGLKKVYVNGIIITVFLCIVFTVLCTLFSKKMLLIMNTPDSIIGEAHKYLSVLFAGITTTMLYNFSCEMLRALGNSKRPFVYLFIASLVNIVLDLIFILVFKMDVYGAALATVIAQALSAVLCITYMYRNTDVFRINLKEVKFDKQIAGECLRLGIPSMILHMVIVSGLVIKQLFLNGIGTDYIASYSAAGKLENIYVMPLYAIMTAMTVFVAQNYGAKDMHRVKLGIRQSMGIMYCIDITIMLISFVISKYLIAFIVGGDNTHIISNGKLYIDVHMIATLALIPLIVYKGALQALGKPLFPTISGFLEVVVRIGAVVIATKRFGFIGILVSDPITWTVTCVFFVIAYIYETKKIDKQILN